jgi:hypothetical protein
VFVGTGAHQPRQALETFVADQKQATEIEYRDTTAYLLIKRSIVSLEQ